VALNEQAVAVVMIIINYLLITNRFYFALKESYQQFDR
jgi:hypothetical protein